MDSDLKSFLTAKYTLIISGLIGKDYYNQEGPDQNPKFAKLFDVMISNQVPLTKPTIAIERAININEHYVTGQKKWDAFRLLMSPAIELPSRHQLDMFRQEFYPDLEEWENGSWHDLTKGLTTSFEEIFAVENFDDFTVPNNELHIDVLLGADGSGSHKQFQFKDIDVNSRNIIVGGYRPFKISDNSGTCLWEELSQAPETMRPWFLIPGSEKADLVEKIASKMDIDAERSSTLLVQHIGSVYTVHVRFFMSLDGKLIEMTSGLNGAYCTACTASSEEGHNVDCVKDGFPIDRDMEGLWSLYGSLRKRKDGSIITRTKDYKKRFGMTRKPMFKFLNPLDVWPVMHLWIRVYTFFLRLFYNLNAREAFPDHIPTMRGESKGPEINDAIEEAKKNFINEAKKAPINMLIDSPDPHGVGGTTDTANVGKKFLGEKRVQFANLVEKHECDMCETNVNERADIILAMQYSAVICRIVNSTRKVDVDAFEKLCQEAYLHLLKCFPFCNIATSIHRVWAHCAEKMRAMGNHGLGQLSETPLEGTHKTLRRLLKYHARPFLKEGLIDAFNHLYIRTSPMLRSFQGPPKRYIKKPIITEDDEIVARYIIE